MLAYLWYQLPTKYLASLETKREVAAALAALLEGRGADKYAAICRTPEVEEMLALWEDDVTCARRLLRELLDASGLEPPDTALLAWGPVMGLVEADARDRATEVLELAREAGDGVPARAIVAYVLAERTDEGTRLDCIHAERLERWRGRDEPRRAVVQRVVEELRDPRWSPRAKQSSPHAGSWNAGRRVFRSRKNGALPRSLAREAVERWPDWWRTDLFGAPNRETDVARLHRLHGLLREMRLLRRSGRQLRAAARGRRLRQRPEYLLARCAEALLAGDTFQAAVGELAAALLLCGEPADADRLAETIEPVIAAEGWHAGGRPPERRDISWAVSTFLLRAEPAGIVACRERRLTAAGCAALHHGLRARALGPAGRIL